MQLMQFIINKFSLSDNFCITLKFSMRLFSGLNLIMISTKIKIIEEQTINNNVDNNNQDDSANNKSKKKSRKKKFLTTQNLIFNDLETHDELETHNVMDIHSKNLKLNITKSNILIKELLNNQLPNINPKKKLTYNDIKRISKFLVSSIFNKNECSLWNGYITNEKNQAKGIYINFYFNQKKIALHRLLYLNYIGDILNTEYIKFSCVNRGKCCNIHHMKKYTYNSNLLLNNNENRITDNSIHIIQNKDELIVEL